MRFSTLFRGFTILSLIIGLGDVSTANARIYPMNKVYQVASSGTHKALRALKALDSQQLNVTDKNGNTAICQAILAHNYKAFNLLKQAGANLQARCIHNIPPTELQAFNRDYATWARSVNRSSPLRSSSYTRYRTPRFGKLSPATWVGIGVGAAALIGGGVAIASSGGGGGSGSSSSGGGAGGGGSGGHDDGSTPIGNTIDLDKTNPASYVTTEFNKGNFLSQIGAQYAYARGFGGYIVNDDTSKGDAVKVGVLDGGTDINNPDLAGSIMTNADGKRYGYNFDYGPCRNGDTTHCYGVKITGKIYGYDVGNIVFYKTGANDYDVIEAGNYLPTALDSVFSNYASDYDWDKLKDDPSSHDISTEENTIDSYLNVSAADHGTHTAGIVGANMNSVGMHGVAPFVSILAGVYDPISSQYGFETALQTYAAEGVRVINMSFGSPATSGTVNTVSGSASNFFVAKEISGYQIAHDNNIVIVRAAGNDGNGYAASYSAGIPLTTTFGKGSAYDMSNLFITVVATDKNNKLASYSQTCGAAQGYCLSAPGGDIDRGILLWNTIMSKESTSGYDPADVSWTTSLIQSYKNGEITVDTVNKQISERWGILSTVQNDNNHLKTDGVAYGYMQGTSMATPVATGAVATLMGAYPHLTSQQVVEILFRSANKDLAGWTNDGTWTYKTKDNVTHTLYTSQLYGHGMIDLNAATQPLGELDIPLGASVNENKASLTQTALTIPRNIFSKQILFSGTVVALDDYQRGFAVKSSALFQQAHRNPDGFKKSFRSFMAKKHKMAGIADKLSFSFSNQSVSDDNLLGMGAIDMRLQLTSRNAMTLSYRSDVLGEERHFDRVLANPFIDMRESYGLTHTFNMNKTWAFSFGGHTGKNGFFDGDKDLNEEYNRSMQAFTSEICYHPFSQLTLRAIGGLVNEKDSLLGLHGSGAFDTDTSRTYFTGAIVEYTPIKPLTLSAAYYYGRSQMPKTSSLLSLSDVLSDSFAFDARYQLDPRKTVGFQFSSPLRIRRGTALFDIPVARDMYSDTVYHEQWDVSLKPAAREYDLGFYYTHETDNYDWRSELVTRFHPDHISNARPDYRALFGLSLKY